MRTQKGIGGNATREARRAAGQCATCGVVSAKFLCRVCQAVATARRQTERARQTFTPAARLTTQLRGFETLLAAAERCGAEVPPDVFAAMQRIQTRLVQHTNKRKTRTGHLAPEDKRKLVELADRLVRRSLALYRGTTQ